jgi:hypothetical protein
VKSLLWAICIALVIALAMCVWPKPSDFWRFTITDVLMVIATVALVGATIALWLSAKRSTEITERGYVKISHTAPGIVFDAASSKLEVQIKNAGRTPASVIDLLLKQVILNANEELPLVPDYSALEPEPKEAFLAAGDKVFVSRSFDLKHSELEAVRSGAARLFLFGYVDYVDVFNKHHRAGYARSYEPSRDTGDPSKRNNLLIVPSRAYNYDKPMLAWTG